MLNSAKNFVFACLFLLMGTCVAHTQEMPLLWEHHSTHGTPSFSPDGRHVLFASWDGSVLYDMIDQKFGPELLYVNGGGIMNVVWNAKGDLFLTAGKGGHLRDGTTGKSLFSVGQGARTTASMGFAREAPVAFYSSHSAIVDVFNVQTGVVVWRDTLEEAGLSIRDAVITNDGSKLLVMGTQHLYEYEIGNSTPIRSFGLRHNAIGLSEDNETLLTVSSKGDVTIYAYPSEEIIQYLPMDDRFKAPTRVKMNGAGTRFIVLNNKRLSLWDTETLSEIAVVQEPIQSKLTNQSSRYSDGLFFSYDDQYLIKGYDKGEMIVWSADSLVEVKRVVGGSSPYGVDLMVCSPALDRFLISTHSQPFPSKEIYSFEKDSLLLTLTEHEVSQALFMPEGGTLFINNGRTSEFVSTNDGSLISRNAITNVLQNRQRSRPTLAATFGVDSVLTLFDPVNGKVLASKHIEARYPDLHLISDTTIVYLNEDTVISLDMNLNRVWSLYAQSLFEFSFSEAVQLFAITFKVGSEIQFGSLNSGSVIGSIDTPSGQHTARGGFSFDGSRYLQRTSYPSESIVMDIGNVDKGIHTVLRRFTDHSSVGMILETPQPNEYVTYALDSTVRIWNIDESIQTTVLHHDTMIRDAVVHPSLPILLSRTYDDSVMLWNYETGKRMTSGLHALYHTSVFSFSPDGTKLLETGSRLRMYDISSFLPVSVQETRDAEPPHNIDITPHPVREGSVVTVSFDCEDGQTLSVYSLDGALVWSTVGKGLLGAQSFTLTLNEQPSGTYLLVAVAGCGSTSTTFRYLR